jgi:hypothetical protein
MRKGDLQLGTPDALYKGAKAAIEALSGVPEGAIAYATDSNEFGSYDGSAWTWGQGGGGSPDWGDIGGTLSDQTDLQAALDAKLDDTQLEDAINNGEVTKAPTENAVFDALALKLNTSQLEDAINNGEVTKAPTENAVFDALALKLNTSQLEDAVNNGEVTKAPTENAVYDALAAVLAATQPLDSDLTAIAGLSPADDDIIQRKAGAWTNRTLSQLATDLTELIQDIIGQMVVGNVETNIAVSYDDTNGKLDFVITSEQLQDFIGDMIGDLNGINITYDDTDGKIDYSVDDGYINDLIQNFTDSQLTPRNGWIYISDTWTYASADDPVYQIYVSGDVTANADYKTGNKIKCTNNSTTFYGFIVKVGAYDSGNNRTPVDVYGGTDYDLANSAITAPFIGKVKSPDGFPLNPDKWTVKTTDSADRTQASPTTNTWYNPGSLGITIPIGVWVVSYKVLARTSRAAATATNMASTLSTANNSESDAEMTTFLTINGASGTLVLLATQHCLPKIFALTSKTSYFLNCRTTAGSDSIGHRGDTGTTTIKAVCAYL